MTYICTITNTKSITIMNSAKKLNQAQLTIAQNWINLYNEVNKLRKDGASEEVIEGKCEEMEDWMVQMCKDIVDYVEGICGEFCFC